MTGTSRHRGAGMHRPDGPRMAGRGVPLIDIRSNAPSSEHQTRLDGHVTRHPPLTGTMIITRGAQNNAPGAVGRVPVGKVDTPIMIIVARDGDVAACTPRLSGDSRPPDKVNVAFGAVDDPPL